MQHQPASYYGTSHPARAVYGVVCLVSQILGLVSQTIGSNAPSAPVPYSANGLQPHPDDMRHCCVGLLMRLASE